jgi:hypothetical protein
MLNHFTAKIRNPKAPMSFLPEFTEKVLLCSDIQNTLTQPVQIETTADQGTSPYLPG